MKKIFVFVICILFLDFCIVLSTASSSLQEKIFTENMIGYGMGIATMSTLIFGMVSMNEGRKSNMLSSYAVINNGGFHQHLNHSDGLNQTLGLSPDLFLGYWSDKMMISYETGKCLYGEYDVGDFDCETYWSNSAEKWTQRQPTGYPYSGWFHLTTTWKGQTQCLQAGSRTGYSSVVSGDRVIMVPCVGGEPTQIWQYGSFWNTYFQFKELSSGKCLDWDRYNNVPVMWECNYSANNQWFGAMNDRRTNVYNENPYND